MSYIQQQQQTAAERNEKKVVKRLKNTLMDRFAMTDMGEVNLIFGIAVTREYDAGTLFTTQKDYIENTLEGFRVLYRNPVHTTDSRSRSYLAQRALSLTKVVRAWC